jgi:hypothetical protein
MEALDNFMCIPHQMVFKFFIIITGLRKPNTFALCQGIHILLYHNVRQGVQPLRLATPSVLQGIRLKVAFVSQIPLVLEAAASIPGPISVLLQQLPIVPPVLVTTQGFNGASKMPPAIAAAF